MFLHNDALNLSEVFSFKFHIKEKDHPNANNTVHEFQWNGSSLENL